jgi:hypothetical protein
MPVTRSGRTDYTYVAPTRNRPAGETPPENPATPETSPQSLRGRAPPGVPGQHRPSGSGSPGAQSSARVRPRTQLPSRETRAQASSSSSAARSAMIDAMFENYRTGVYTRPGAERNALGEARDDIEADMDFATLCSALEVGVPARVRAAISLIADGTAGPDEFFHAHSEGSGQTSVIDSLLQMYASPHRPDLSQFQEGLAPTRFERLSSDIDCLQQLLTACAQSPHPEIQEAARRHEVAPAHMLIQRAASMSQEYLAEAINLVAPMLDALLEKLEQGDEVPHISSVAQALDEGLTSAATHPDAREIYHSYGLRVMEHQPDSPEKAEQAVRFVQSAQLLPRALQQGAFRDAFDLIAQIPQGILDPQGRMGAESHPLAQCAHVLAGLHRDVFAGSAIALLRACKGVAENIRLRPSICRSIAQIVLQPEHDTGEVPFAGLPDGDKMPLFLQMLDASVHQNRHQSGGAAQWGTQMLQHLPPSERREAGDMLLEAELGHVPMGGF